MSENNRVENGRNGATQRGKAAGPGGGMLDPFTRQSLMTWVNPVRHGPDRTMQVNDLATSSGFLEESAAARGAQARYRRGPKGVGRSEALQNG